MPRFHLHLHNRTGSVPDVEGQDLPDEAAAREEAIRSIRSIVSAEVQDGFVDLNGRVEIADGGGEVVAVVPFTDAVRVEARG